jgi:transposase-like protein
MTCPRCRNEGATRRKNGRDATGAQKWRASCDHCRREQQRQYRGTVAYGFDKMLLVQVTIDAALGRPW